MSNRLDPVQLAIEVTDAVAMAQLDEIEAQAIRLGALVDQNEIETWRAADILRTAALASGLIHRYGEDEMQDRIATGFSQGLIKSSLGVAE